MTSSRGAARARRGGAAMAVGAAVSGSALIFATAASASPSLLTRGHAYCFYFSTPANGGMHLVAAGPRSISAGPSNYISGVNGKPQDTVVFVGCVDAAGNQNGSAYMGLPAFTMRVVKGHYEFAKRFVIKNVRLLDAASAASITATVTLSGTAIPGSSSTGAIRGTLRVSAPGCLSRTLVLPYTGT